jgi:hypothetical protein
LTYLGYADEMLPVDINQVGTSIMIAWSDALAPSINGTETAPFVKLRFIYNGVGVAHIGFGSDCSFANLSARNLNVAYTDATITPKTTGVPTVTIGTETGYERAGTGTYYLY